MPKSIVTELRDGSINNPALPNETINIDSRSPIIGAGFQRQYIDSQTIGRFFPNENSSAPSLFPKRPPPGSIADFDVIMRTCNYKNEQVCHVLLLRYFSFFYSNSYTRHLATALNSSATVSVWMIRISFKRTRSQTFLKAHIFTLKREPDSTISQSIYLNRQALRYLFRIIPIPI